ncbi:two-component system response regulator DesR [Ectobacillus funiculus]
MITIVIAEDQKMLLGAFGSLLNLEEDMIVVGQASNGEEAVALVREFQPDVCIMDIEMPGKSGLDAAEEIKGLGCKVIILTTFARSGYFQRALKAGVSGYLLKDSPSEELASSIRDVMAGKKEFMRLNLWTVFMVRKNPLTDREREVLGLVADGKKTQKRLLLSLV